MKWVKLNSVSFEFTRGCSGYRCVEGWIISACMSIQWHGLFARGDSASKSMCSHPIVEPFLHPLPISSCILLMQLSHRRDHLIPLYTCVSSSFVFPPLEAVGQLPPAAQRSISLGWSWQREARLKSLAQDISLNQWNLNVEPVPQALGTLFNTAGQTYLFMNYNIAEKNKMTASTWQKLGCCFLILKKGVLSL